LSFVVPETWIATSGQGAQYRSPDYTLGCQVPGDPTAELCLVKGSWLAITERPIDPTIQNAAAFEKFYTDANASNESIDSSLPAPFADAVIVTKIQDSTYAQFPNRAPQLFTEEARVLKNGKEYDVSIATLTSFEASRSILAKVLQSMNLSVN